MNARQLALRTAVHARDYSAIEQLIDAGATAGDMLQSVLHDIVRTRDVTLYEILICAAPAGYDFELARAIEMNIRSGTAGFADGEVLGMHIRAAFLTKLLVDQLLEDNRKRLELAFESSAAIVELAGLEQTENSVQLKQQIMAGKISFDEAVQILLNSLQV